MMHPFRCELCGETYVGGYPAERCPFCGAAGKYLMPAAEWMKYGKIEMCKQSYEDCQKALDLGAQAFLTKPYSPNQLLAQVRRYCTTVVAQ